MVPPKGEVWFLASCVELYKVDKGMTGQQAYEYLLRHDAIGFIVERWEGLHTTSPRYVIDSIDDYIKGHSL